MRCNACWRELEGRAISTTCGHLLCIQMHSIILLFAFLYILYTFSFSFKDEEIISLAYNFLNCVKGTEDANKILSNDAACPICDQVLSKR